MGFYSAKRVMRTAVIGLLAPFSLWAVTINKCPKGEPTPASYTWDFVGEANNLFDQLDFQDQKLMRTTDALLAMTWRPGEMSWQSHAWRLTQAKYEVNQMAEILCRLETIRSAVEPWQMRLIDRLHDKAVLSAVHVEAAINYLNDNKTRIDDIGSPVYNEHIRAVYDNARALDHNLDRYTALARAEKRVRDLESANAS
jgi:hypothetical protein